MGTHLQQAGAGRPDSTGSMRGRVIGWSDFRGSTAEPAAVGAGRRWHRAV